MNKKNRMVDIKALITRILYFWRLILLFTLVFALLGAGRSYVKQKGELAQAQTKQENEKKEDGENSESVDLSFSEELKMIDQQLAYRQDFVRNAPLMRVNPFKANLVTVRYKVQKENSDEESETVVSEATTDDTQNIEDEVTELLSMVYDRYVDWEKVGKDIGEEYYYYIKDCVDITKAGDIYRISVVYDDEKDANVIMDHIEEAISKGLTEYENITGLSFTRLGRDSMNSISYDRMMFAANRTEQLNRLMTARNELINKADIVNKNGVRASSGNIKLSISKKDLLKSSIKFGIIGAALSLLYAAAKTLLGNKVLSAQELYDNYELNPLYSDPIVSKKNDKIDQFISKLLNGKTNGDSEEMMKMCAMEIEQTSNESEIVLTGDLSKEELNSLLSQLSTLCKDKNFVSCADPINNSSDREILNNAKETIIFAKQEKSSYSTLDNVIQLLKNRDINILGSICK